MQNRLAQALVQGAHMLGNKGKVTTKINRTPIVGFSNLIKRDFFNRDGPKREPMVLFQNGSETDFGTKEFNVP